MEEQSRPEVVIGTPGGDRLKIRFLGRLHPEVDDQWDGNWISAFIDYRVGQFEGSVAASLRSEELARFGSSLRDVSRTLRGEAVYESMENWLSLRLRVDAAGRVIVLGTVSDRAGVGNKLEFEIDGLDQSYLPAMIEELDDALIAYPVLK